MTPKPVSESPALRKIRLLECCGHFTPEMIRKMRIDYFRRLHVTCLYCHTQSELWRWRFTALYHKTIVGGKEKKISIMKNPTGNCSVVCPECMTGHEVWRLYHGSYIIQALDEYGVSPTELFPDTTCQVT